MNVPRLVRAHLTEGVICPCCERLEHMPIEMVLDEDRFSVLICDSCLRKLHERLDEARAQEAWGLPMGALS